MRDASGHGQQSRAGQVGRTMPIPRTGEDVVIRLSPIENRGRRMRLVVQDPNNLIEGVQIDRTREEVVSF